MQIRQYRRGYTGAISACLSGDRHGTQPELIIIGAGGNEMKNIPGTSKLLKRLGMLEAVRKGRVCYLGDSLYRPGPGIPAGIA